MKSYDEKEEEKKEKKSQIETDDALNRLLYGTPTIGGAIVIGAIIVFILYSVFF